MMVRSDYDTDRRSLEDNRVHPIGPAKPLGSGTSARSLNVHHGSPSSLTIAMLSGDEIATHNSVDDLWMVIGGNCYDLTDFAPSHPGSSDLFASPCFEAHLKLTPSSGGLKILLKYAGKDATEEYVRIWCGAPAVRSN